MGHITSLKLQVGAALREQRVKIGSDRGSRWSLTWRASVRDNDQLSETARWIVNDLLDEIDHHQKKLMTITIHLRETTANDPIVKLLMDQPGIGEVTAWVFRAFVGRFDRFKTGKQLSRYCGMSPCNASSGRKVSDAGLVDGCNPILRTTVVQASHRLIRTEKRWREMSDRMKRRGKPSCVVVAAVGNRWLRKLHHVMKTATMSTSTMKSTMKSTSVESASTKSKRKSRSKMLES